MVWGRMITSVLKPRIHYPKPGKNPTWRSNPRKPPSTWSVIYGWQFTKHPGLFRNSEDCCILMLV